jgi:hypothetical protein
MRRRRMTCSKCEKNELSSSRAQAARRRLGPAAARYVPTPRSNGDDAMAQISKALGSGPGR